MANPHLEAQFQNAVALHRSGALTDAEPILQDVLREQPEHFGALYLSGLIALRTNRPRLAVERIQRAVTLNPTIPVAHTNLGTALLQTGRFADALICCRNAIHLQPNQMEAHFNAGMAQLNLARPEEAAASFDNAIALAPDHPEAWFQRGAALAACGRTEAAVFNFDRAIALRPDHAEAQYRRGTACMALRRFDEAVAALTSAIALRPDFAAAHNDLGVSLASLRRYEDAAAPLRRAIALRPDFPQAHNNLGGALWYLGLIDEAIETYGTAIALRPDYAEPYSNRGAALADLLRLEEAIADYARAIHLRPDYAEAHCNLGGAYLQLGRFDPGWKLWEWRKRIPEAPPDRGFAQSSWSGEYSLSGKTLLIHAESGLGDMIQFSRYARLATEAGARVVMEAPPPLFTLLRDSHPAITVIAAGQSSGAFDCHCSDMSLPLAFNTTLETIPSEPAYLRAGAAWRAKWAARLPAKTKPRIGLAWSGNPEHKNDHNRSISLATCLPLIRAGLAWFCLHPEVRPHDAAILGPDIQCFGEALADFSDTAALVELLDLVITIDTSVAHLAGAMGKPTWLLLPFHPDWRWLLDRDDSPWYPSMRLFRRSKPGDWAGVIQRVSTALDAWSRGVD